VEVDEAADARLVWLAGFALGAVVGGEDCGEAVEGLVLGRVAWGEATVGLAAGVRGGAA